MVKEADEGVSEGGRSLIVRACLASLVDENCSTLDWGNWAGQFN